MVLMRERRGKEEKRSGGEEEKKRRDREMRRRGERRERGERGEDRGERKETGGEEREKERDSDGLCSCSLISSGACLFMIAKNSTIKILLQIEFEVYETISFRRDICFCQDFWSIALWNQLNPILETNMIQN